MELIPCACVLIPLVLAGAWLAFAPLFKRAAEPVKDQEREETPKESGK